jgi:hypothetical protein
MNKMLEKSAPILEEEKEAKNVKSFMAVETFASRGIKELAAYNIEKVAELTAMTFFSFFNKSRTSA